MQLIDDKGGSLIKQLTSQLLQMLKKLAVIFGFVYFASMIWMQMFVFSRRSHSGSRMHGLLLRDHFVLLSCVAFFADR